ncbi:MAG: EAL domain-containing protein [Gemmatimonadetes bacterium]|nr:MAG: EAL domain-containing protein [Gemmatimonadota bacterium]
MPLLHDPKITPEERALAQAHSDFLRLKRLLYDNISKLPSLPVVVDNLKKALESYKHIGVISLSIQTVALVELQYGWQAYDNLIIEIAQQLNELIGNVIQGEVVLAMEYARSDEFLIFCLSQPDEKSVTLEYMEHVSERLFKALNDHLGQYPVDSIYRKVGLNGGFAIITNNRVVRAERLIYHGLNEAKRMAALYESRRHTKQIETLRSIIAERQIATTFQPIIYMADLRIMAYEALSVSPKEAGFPNTEVLFSIAQEAGLGLKLDRLCRENAITNASKMADHYKLFVNVEPSAIDDPEFRQAQFVEFMQSHGIEPSKVVLEITERTAIKDYDIFLKSLKYFQDLGFEIAVDDAGAGYASLNSIAYLRPKFLKFDHALVQNIHKTPIKQQLLETLIDFADKIGAHVIAEGIESIEEFEMLREMNVEFGQGYYIARPDFTFPDVREELVNHMNGSQPKKP